MTIGKRRWRLLVVAALVAWAPLGSAARLEIGTTLHPYYSWVSNIVMEDARVVPLLPATTDPHVYQPRAEDIARLASLDVLVINGNGHDAFVPAMLTAAGDRVPAVIAVSGVGSTAAGATVAGTAGADSHDFLSVAGAVGQVDRLARELARIDSGHAVDYITNARAYKRRLRRLLANAQSRLRALDTDSIRIGTVHDGYGYLFQEIGLTVSAVVQPRHGVQPSARQLADSVNRIRDQGIDILFTEADYDAAFVDTLRDETGTRVVRLTHISAGEYTASHFEEAMTANLDAIIDALYLHRQADP